MDGMLKTTGIVVQARLDSSRLPAKVFLPLGNGKSVVETVVERCLRIRDRLGLGSPVCLAVPKEELDLFRKHSDWPDNVLLVGGSAQDVLGRFEKAIDAIGAERIIRVTADNPLLVIEPFELIIETFRGFREPDSKVIVDLYSSKQLPNGTVVSGFTGAALHAMAEHSTLPATREHLVIGDDNEGGIERVVADIPARLRHPKLRFCVDTIADYLEFLKLPPEAYEAISFAELEPHVSHLVSDEGY